MISGESAKTLGKVDVIDHIEVGAHWHFENVNRRRKLRSVPQMGDTRYHHTLWAKIKRIERQGRKGSLSVEY